MGKINFLNVVVTRKRKPRKHLKLKNLYWICGIMEYGQVNEFDLDPKSGLTEEQAYDFACRLGRKLNQKFSDLISKKQFEVNIDLENKKAKITCHEIK